MIRQLVLQHVYQPGQGHTQQAADLAELLQGELAGVLLPAVELSLCHLQGLGQGRARLAGLIEELPQGLTRFHVTSRIGRKTFVTLKIYQGVPKSQVMPATGHQTEKSFNHYLGIDEQELLAIYRRTARKVA